MPERHRILIVDDDASDRQAVVHALQQEAVSAGGIEADILEAGTITQARQAIQNEEFACIFLAHHLPDGTSVDLLLEVRAQGFTTPVVVLTGERDEQAILEVMQAGAVDFLPKEKLHPELVARSLRAALLFRQAQREKQAVLDELRARNRAITAASNGIVIADPRLPDCPLIYVNEAFLHMTGYAEVEVLGRNCRFLQGADTDPATIQELRAAIRQESPCQVLVLNYRRDGSTFWNEVTVGPVRDARGSLTHFVGVQTDVTGRHEADTERRQAHDAVRASEEALRENEGRLQDTQARLEAALSAGGIATWTFDLVSDRVVADANLAQLFSVGPEDAAGGRLGVYLQAIHPDDRARVTEAIADAIAHREFYEAEYRVVLPDGAHRWLASRGKVERDAAGRAVALPGVVLDITERVRREQRERFLADLAERARGMTDPDVVIADAVRSVGEFLGVSRCLFADIDIEADTCTIQPDYCADDSVASIEGVVPISAFGPFVVAEYAARRAVVVDDVRLDPVKAPPETVAAYAAIDIRAHITVPVVHSDRVVSCISVHNSMPRHWEPEEVELLRAVVERTWLTVEVLRQQFALVREVQERHEAHERTAAILDSITDASYAVDAQFCFTHVNRQAEVLWGRAREEFLGQPFLEMFPQMKGSLSFTQHERAMAEREPTHYQTISPILGRWVEISIYPTVDGGLSVFFHDISSRKALEEERERLAQDNQLLLESTGDGIYGIDLDGRFTFVNRAAAQMLGYLPGEMLGRSGHSLIHHSHSDGTPYLEVECPIYRALRNAEGIRVEDDVFWRKDGTSFPVAYTASPLLEHSSVRGAVVTFSDIGERKAQEKERERLAERERNIAQQLQAALTPAIPERIAGMALSKYYEAALDEAGVGGDFYDVFPVDKGCTALVVGDLSGKGLAAASQVATVRNMLRYALYRARTLAGALESLNALLAEQGLLTGFATLFVGAFDGAAKTLTYVNAGQEPALVRRAATGAVEHLPPTGPILGSIEGAAFEEQAVTLESGDAVVLFTDGLTEVGPSRLEMLGIEGVADLLAETVAPQEAVGAEAVAEHLALRLIAGVDAAATGGVTRDDVCLLVAVAE